MKQVATSRHSGPRLAGIPLVKNAIWDCHCPRTEYRRRQHEVLEGLPGIHVIADDILITGQGETHKEALREQGKLK